VAPDTWLLAVAVLLALSLVAVALLLVRRGTSLRARLVVVFVTLALAPSALTLAFLWRELAPRSRLSVAQGVERSLDDAVALARREVTARHGEALDLARRAAARAARGLTPEVALDSLAASSYVGLLIEPGPRRLVAFHGPWSASQARDFLDHPEVNWPSGPLPVQLVLAPDSSTVVVGAARTGSKKSSQVALVALTLPRAQADAIRNLVAGAQHAHRLGFLEELKLQTVVRLVVGFGLFSAALAWLLAFLLARSLLAPLERLRGAFAAVAGGELGHQVEAGTARDHETSQVLQGFNAMSRELEESKAALVRTVRLAAWQDVARRLAHEIKNPLTPITLSIHRLRKRMAADDPVVRECLETILEETSHLERLANEFSSFARLPKPMLQAVEPGPVMSQVFDLHAAHPGVRVRASLEGLPRVLADRDQLRQVFTNVLKNAVEAMPQGGEVEVRWEVSGSAWVITVLDQGAGFTPQALEHLFDPTFTTKPSGSGLGLAIVQRIVADHGGTITAGNRAEGGAWVRIGLQLAS
jgi:signal transduction histidine kinase